jgi:hypothetical protein
MRKKPFALIQMKMKENGKTWWGSDFLKYSYIKKLWFHFSIVLWNLVEWFFEYICSGFPSLGKV